MPIFFHGLTRYDSHFLVNEASLMDDIIGDVKVIARSSEKFMTISMRIKGSKIELVFLDSLLFMNRSLGALAKGVNDVSFLSDALSSNLCFEVMKRGNLQLKQRVELLRKKGIYPYDWMTSMNCFEKELPERASFYSKLRNEEVGETDYSHACHVYTSFECKNMGDYTDLYLATDVLLLAMIFQQFRKMCYKTYELDPPHFLSTPHMAWCAMLKLTKAELDPIPDADTLLFFEKGIHGGFCQVSHRYAKANNPGVPGYDPRLPTTHILYLDVSVCAVYSSNYYTVSVPSPSLC